MEGVRLEDVRLAMRSRDPDLARLIAELASSDALPHPDEVTAEGALSYERFLGELQTWTFRHKSEEEKRAFRQRAFEELREAERLPERLLLHEIVMHLWQSQGAYERAQLLEVIATCPLVWGPWKGIKAIFKHAERSGDVELLGAIGARVDKERAAQPQAPEVSGGTRTYIVRRAWRALRRCGEQFPSRYADVAVETLRFYPEGTNFERTWIANHIMFHAAKRYGRAWFWSRRVPDDLLKHRAFEPAWQRTPRPLFALLERAQSELVRRFAVDALKADFRTSLREVEPGWVARLIEVESATVHEFVIWILGDVPKFEQSAFVDLGLHQGVLKLFYSPSNKARAYAAKYARTHARDLPVEELLKLINNDLSEVRALAESLLKERDARRDVGLEAWGALLGTPYAHQLAVQTLTKHFGVNELSAEWLRARLLSPDRQVRRFAMEKLSTLHASKSSLKTSFLTSLFEEQELTFEVASWALKELSERHDLGAIEPSFWRLALLHPMASRTVRQWIETEKLKARSFGVEFFKALAYQPDFERDAFIQGLKARPERFLRDLGFDQELSSFAMELLGDVRQFGAEEIGFEWLMELVARSESRYHDFAKRYMLKAMTPADFAPLSERASDTRAASASAQVDLQGATFLFTGKLATMTRDEAQGKVTAAHGVNAKSVTASLDYLVIGDEGSPLFGGGKKGSKMVKAEQLQSAGSEIKIISETAFLQRLSGTRREADSGQAERGALALFEMVTAPGQGDDPKRAFAKRYLLEHHELIAESLTSRQVDAGAEVPREFYSWERFKPLYNDDRRAIRAFALQVARVEFKRWAPSLFELLSLSESRFKEVTSFLEEALLAPKSEENALYRLKREDLSAQGAYRFCESLNSRTRQIGIGLIAQYPDMATPSKLFELTESPDRHLRAFAVRAIWALYRRRATTSLWRPAGLEVRYPVVKTKKSQGTQRYESGPGVAPRPQAWPATPEAMREFLRRVLYSIPPTKPSEEEQEAGEALARTVSARQAKRSLVQIMRDLALEEREFAELIAPLLGEFMGSRGQSERAACLVALTQLERAWPKLSALPEGVEIITP